MENNKDYEDNIDVNYVFKNKPTEYQVALSPVQDYYNQASFFLEKMLSFLTLLIS